MYVVGLNELAHAGEGWRGTGKKTRPNGREPTDVSQNVANDKTPPTVYITVPSA
jgi:hypothetical protein